MYSQTIHSVDVGCYTPHALKKKNPYSRYWLNNVEMGYLPIDSNAKDADMRNLMNSTQLKRALVGLSASGLLLGTNCSANELRAVVVGIEAAAPALIPSESQFTITERNNDLNFGQWLISEISD